MAKLSAHDSVCLVRIRWIAASGEMMLLDAIATVILAGMMLIPLVNIFTGVFVGAGLGGMLGAVGGLLLAIAITAAEKLIGDRRGWFDVRCNVESTPAEAMQRTSEATVVARQPMKRRRPIPLQSNRRTRPGTAVAAGRAAPSSVSA